MGVALALSLCLASLGDARRAAVTKIVFASDRSGTWALYTMAPDGSAVQPLWSPVPGGRGPAFSPTGNLIAFESDNYLDPNTLWVVKPDGTRAHQLGDLHINNFHDFHPTWSPDGTKLLLNLNGGIVEMNSDGNSEHTLVPHGSDPAWSPDGHSIVFRRGSSLWTVHSNGSDAHRWHAFGAGVQPQAAWSPDSSQLVVTPDLSLYTASGSLVRRLTWPAKKGGHTSAASPTWAPAHNIAFSGAAGIYRISPSGGAPRLMISNGLEASWGPGGRLVYNKQDSNNDSHLYITGAGSGVHALGGVYTYLAMPVWSPDGSKVAFVDGSKLAFVSADGSGLRVTAVPTNGNHGGVTWAPDGTKLAVSNYETLSVVHPDGSIVWSLHIPSPYPGDPPLELSQPAWAPGGATIVVPGYDSGGTSQIYSVPAAGGSSSVLVRDSSNRGSPDQVSFSPDGLHIAYTAFSAGIIVQVAKADGSAPTTVYTLPGNPVLLGATTTWSPAGSRVIFNETASDGTEQIESVPAAGGSATALTSPPGSNRGPNP
jgi:Tol biopolymer transport system component